MALTKEQKTKQLERIKENLSRQRSLLLIEFSKIPVKDFFSLRKDLKKEGCELKVVKKTLARIALEQLNLPYAEKIKSSVPGQLALLFSFSEEITPVKIAVSFSKNHENFKIMGGIFSSENGFEFLEKEMIVSLANLPSKKELFGQLVFYLSYPLRGLIDSLNNNLKGLIFLLNNIKEQKVNPKTSN